MKQPIHTQSLKIIVDETANIKTIEGTLQAVKNTIKTGRLDSIRINGVALEDLRARLETLDEVFSMRDGALQGCFGVNTGRYDTGFTIEVDVEYLPDRMVETHSDGSKTEYFNPVILIEENGGELVKELEDLDAWLETIEYLGVRVINDNTYNYQGCSDDPSAMYEVDFKIVEGENCAYLVAKFHHGGDVRGNYGKDYLFKFDSITDIYEALFPYSQLVDEEAG